MTPSHSIIRRQKSENRRQIRYPGNNAVVRASWIDIAGSLRMGQARLVDICEGGMAMELPERPQPNTYIRFQCDKMKINGTGAVRHCQSSGSRFVVGLEFSAGVRWKPPEPPQPQAELAVRPMQAKPQVDSPVRPVQSRAQDSSIEWNWLFDMSAIEPMAMVGAASGND